MNISLDNTALVVAHPTDEIIFFGSVLDKVDHIYVCYTKNYKRYPNTNINKANAIKCISSIQKNITFLDLPEPNLLETGDFNACNQGPFGLTASNIPERDIIVSFEKLIAKLVDNNIHKYNNIITHNMWGENGHEENIFVQRAISTIQRQYKYNIFTNTFYSSVSEKLMNETINNYSFLCNLDVNSKLCEIIKQLYIYHQSGIQQWQWLVDYKWNKQEALHIQHNNIISTTKLY